MSIKWLIYVSFLTILIDGIFGLDIHLQGSDRLSYLYRAAFLTKVILVIIGIFCVSELPKHKNIILLIIILFTKLLIGYYYYGLVKSLVGHAYFYSFIILGYIAGWQLARSNLNKIRINKIIFKAIIWSTLCLCILYYSLYKIGFITYFGMGLQSYIIVAIYMGTNIPRYYQFIILLMIILTGKRSSFLIFIAQTFGPKICSGRLSLVGIVSGVLSFVLIIYLSYEIGLLYRFQSMLDLFAGFEEGAYDERRDLSFLATSGRTEEVYAYFLDIGHSWYGWLFGQVSGYSFIITDFNGILHKYYYFHISPINMILHFGLPIGIIIVCHQFSVFFWAVRYVAYEKDIFCLLFIGFYLSSLFGAIIIVDISFWLLYFYCYFKRQSTLKVKNLSMLKYKKKINSYV